MDFKEIPDFFCNTTKRKLFHKFYHCDCKWLLSSMIFFKNGNGKKSRQNHKFRERKSEVKLNENF